MEVTEFSDFGKRRVAMLGEPSLPGLDIGDGDYDSEGDKDDGD